MKLSQLTEYQLGHLAWRLDAKTACGYLTALRIARLELGDLDITEIFQKYGGRTLRSAQYNTKKVIEFKL